VNRSLKPGKFSLKLSQGTAIPPIFIASAARNSVEIDLISIVFIEHTPA
jgi:hypothetical protein